MWKAFQQLSESSESSRSWHFQANEQESYLVKSLLHDLFKTSTRHHTVLYLFIFYYREYSFSWQKIEDSCKVTVDEVRLWMSRNPLVTVIMDSVFHHLFPIVSSNHTYILQLVNFQHSHQWRIAFCFQVSEPEHARFAELPLCAGVDWKKSQTLLKFEDVFALNFNLPECVRSEWRLLFSSRQHGRASF